LTNFNTIIYLQFPVKEQKSTEIGEIRRSHEAYIFKLEQEHSIAVDKMRTTHADAIKTLQSRHENQMEGMSWRIELYTDLM